MSIEAKKLVVLGLPWDVDTEGLRQYMSQFGELADVMVMKDRASGRSRGFGYVTFTSLEDAEKALVAQHSINGRTLEVKVATPKEEMMSTSKTSTRVFVARISPSVTDEDFHSYFMKYGPIIDAYMPKDPVTKQPRGIGFVTYENPDSVDQLMSETHELKGSTIAVDHATPKGGSKGFRVSSHYLRVPQASRTISATDHNNIDCNSRMAISDSQGNNLLASEIQSASEGVVAGFVAAGDASSLMVSNKQNTDLAPARCEKKLFIGRVPVEATSEDLHSYFSQFGWVLDVYLPKDAKKISHRGFGFVTFADEASAARVARRRHFLHGREVAIDLAAPADNVHVSGQILVNRLLSNGGKEDLPHEVMVGAATEDDSSVRPSAGSNAKWGNRLFIGRIPTEATVVDVRLHFSQFGHVSDVYLPKDDKKTSHRGFGFVTFVDEISAEYASQKVHRILGQKIVLDRAAPLENDGGSTVSHSSIFPMALHGTIPVQHNFSCEQMYDAKFTQFRGGSLSQPIRPTLRYKPY
uniref:Putative ELAV-like protein 3 isoform X1 n=1 Tax=Davidia involucrata TaxID=16924 RepID=A0A5B6YZ54_DAVIN